MLGLGTLRKVRAAGYGIGEPLQRLGAEMTGRAAKMTAAIPSGSSGTMARGTASGMRARAGMVGASGRAISAMGMRPGRTMAVGGIAGIGLASQMRNRTALSGGSVTDMTRQDTMYNRRMRQGQSTALSGLQPRSMGGYS
jgi:hypothetical protein